MPTRENDLRYYFENNQPITEIMRESDYLELLREVVQSVMEVGVPNKNNRIYSYDVMDSLRYIPYFKEPTGIKPATIFELYPRMIMDKYLSFGIFPRNGYSFLRQLILKGRMVKDNSFENFIYKNRYTIFPYKFKKEDIKFSLKTIKKFYYINQQVKFNKFLSRNAIYGAGK